MLDSHGDISPEAVGSEGLFHEGTRFISRLGVQIGAEPLLLLSSSVLKSNTLLGVDLTNRDVRSTDGATVVPKGTLHVFRSTILWEAVCYERIHISNYGVTEIDLELSIEIEADYADIFELRGDARTRRGEMLPPQVADDEIALSYRGLDDIVRTTRIRCSPPPDQISTAHARYAIKLNPQESRYIHLCVACELDDAVVFIRSYDDVRAESQETVTAEREAACEVRTSNEQFNEWLGRSRADLLMMLTNTRDGIYPYAGIPWFNSPFGRDGVITALECLWVKPEVAAGVLTYLANTQAKELDDSEDAEPGKILHEVRRGEMSNVGEVPFKRYYGSADATPLFVQLAGKYYSRTGDLSLVESIWPNIEAALNWIDEYGDLDGDGFVEYQRKCPNGLENQGWKDSSDSIFHQDGTLAESPIALCEVQGNVYAAKRAAAVLARALGLSDSSNRLNEDADGLKKRFNDAFWCDDLGTYAIALDREKRQCRVRSSNAGQCLATGIAEPARAAVIAENLLSDTFFSGWGVRTIATTESRYNPMSYHNGSIWPHDNATDCHPASLALRHSATHRRPS